MLKNLIQEENWKHVVKYCKYNPHLSLPSNFFQDFPKEISFYSSQLIFNTLHDVKQKYIQNKLKKEEDNFNSQSKKEKYESTLNRYEMTKKDLLNQLEKVNKEIEDTKKKIEEHIRNTQSDRIKFEETIKVISKIEESEKQNEKILSEMNQKMKDWKKENENKKLIELDSPQDVCCLLTLMNIKYDTKQKISGGTLFDMRSKAFKEILKVESYGDRKRLVDMVHQKETKIQSLVENVNVPLKTKEGLNDEKVIEWSFKDVSNWISNQEEEKEIIDNFKNHKLDGKQLLLLKDEEIQNEMGIKKEENLKKIRNWIGQLKEKNKVNMISLIVIPEEYKCPLTKRLMEDPVMADDGIVYDRSAIMDYFKKSNISPVTNEAFDDFEVKSNKQLKKKIDSFKSENNL